MSRRVYEKVDKPGYGRQVGWGGIGVDDEEIVLVVPEQIDRDLLAGLDVSSCNQGKFLNVHVGSW